MPKEVILAADVGGTNTTIALFSKNKLVQKFSFDSQKVSIDEAVRQVVDKTPYEISAGCIAAAGPISPDRKTCKLTNVPRSIDVRKLPFKCLLLNDFEALGYSINVLTPKDVKVVRRGEHSELPIALLGAGTGLGKALLIHNGKYYVPMASEGGHADLPLTKSEIQLLGDTLDYEDVLSGRGIVRIYRAYGGKDKSPADIMAEDSALSRKTKELFTTLYARCAKNFALDGLARGGVFIAGGIAAKNPGLFGKEFLDEFVNCKAQRQLLEKIPIKVITNYDVSLYGAAFAASRASF